MNRTLQLSDVPQKEKTILENSNALNYMLGKDVDAIKRLSSMLNINIRVMANDKVRLALEIKEAENKISDSRGKLKINKQLPYMVSDVVQLLPLKKDDSVDHTTNEVLQKYRRSKAKEEEEKDKESGEKDKEKKKDTKTGVVIKTSSQMKIFLPVAGTVEAEELEPAELVGVNKDSYLIMERLTPEFDSRLKAFEIDERPTEDYNDVGGLDKQIEELYEAVVLPITKPEMFKKIGVTPPKGVLLHGPPGTGKTLLAKACAAKTNACFLKIAAPQLVQMYTGDGARIVRDVFRLAATKGNCILFIDEIDAIGKKRFDSSQSGDREVQRTMLELLNQLDGFSSNEKTKIIACTNRPDVLDPALMRSGRLDRKIEFPLPDQSARKRILAIHSKKMRVNKDVNFEELARSTLDFNGAQLKAVCVEAGMVALRKDSEELVHEDYVEGLFQVMQKKKASLDYYA